jgi:hypothetical protein
LVCSPHRTQILPVTREATVNMSSHGRKSLRNPAVALSDSTSQCSGQADLSVIAPIHAHRKTCKGIKSPILGDELRPSIEFRNSLVAAQGIELEFKESIAPALGMSYGGKIAILPGQSAAEEFSTLVHEASHELLHKSGFALHSQ